MKCPFCGSPKTMVETPYIDRWTGEHKLTPCCTSQKVNMDYVKNSMSPYQENKPTVEDVSKL